MEPNYIEDYRFLLVLAAVFATVLTLIFKAGYTLGRERQLRDQLDKKGTDGEEE